MGSVLCVLRLKLLQSLRKYVRYIGTLQIIKSCGAALEGGGGGGGVKRILGSINWVH